uniref:Thioredoxin domain-containing protein 17 n=1 Tax=Trichuris muris TaxID=70415 RepID=A0A5S6R3S4_TRIMR
MGATATQLSMFLCIITILIRHNTATGPPAAGLMSTTKAPEERKTPYFRYVSDVRGMKQLIAQAPAQYNIYVLYCGSKGQQGYSWCPMCVALEQYIKNLAHYMPQETLLIYAEVGTVEQFRDPDNHFRNVCRVKVTTVPTLQNWRTDERLINNECFDFGRLTKFLGIEDYGKVRRVTKPPRQT